ncbi:GumC family protein [Laspinema olomoucense]|uniref:GumC family protein n=1 Tax=Laspinema olomoucense TaxID=3231600 RepID=UPI0021BA5B8C|nr:polysaccharide biosynthesis tyrosine autokinase [Laspinema sp. D3a]MCT7990264.1 AAA family ATPase [Laspinema sp. D3a]
MAPPILKRYAIAFGKYKWFGFAAFVLTLGAAGFVAMQPPPEETYRARGALTYTTPAVTFSATGTQIQEQGKALPKEILLAENVVTAVGTQVNEDPKKLVKEVYLKMPKPDGPPQIELGYTHPNRETAETTVRALMEAMIEQSRILNTSALRRMIDTIEERLPEALAELREAEQKLEEYEREEAVAILAAKSGGLAGAIVANQNQQREIGLQLEGLDAQLASLEQRLGLTADQAYVSQALSADPIIAQLRAALHQIESQRELLSKDFRPLHPQMIELQKQETSYNELLERRATEVIGGGGMAAPLMNSAQIRKDSSLDPARQQLAQTLVNLQTQRETWVQQLNSLTQTEQQLQRDYKTLPNKELERTRLVQQVALKQDLYNKMQQALADAKAAEAETSSSLSVAQETSVSKNEVSTQPPALIFALGGVVGILIGNALIFAISLLEGKFYTMEEVRGALQQQDLRILGILPEVFIPEFNAHEMPILMDPDSPYLEFYEKIRSNLLRIGEKAPKVLLITSVAAQEGKTLCAYNLAIAAARAGKRTLLIEADLRSPSQARSLQVEIEPDANLEPLRYYGQFHQCIRLAPEIENLYVVPSAGPLKNSAAAIESNEFRRLLEDARARFDLVILDSPALSVNNDAFLLEPFSDGMILVTRPRYTQGGMLTEYVEPLTESETVQLLGAVINGADIPVALPESIPTKPPLTLAQSPEAPQLESIDNKPSKIPTRTSR